ncbi:cytochrome c-type biogenesis protein [Chondromyces apiculatus]|uniref:Cytochrome c-type biogenesis protein n=1 Tax=Chondromyces apiculatus DSM 436 TaxID=1192034 RepID=A0A017T3N5_9BACT|nr:cytochrome c-type biogenesis protein CcmH [Chondromyces apiculatus]EYF03577.1 putative cytochrome c biogenesis protein [Chondromyces apiculatus DSM 436]
MNTRRRLFQAATLLLAGVIGFFVMLRSPEPAHGQGIMARWGTVGIETEEERQLFWSLLCMCGCPRETLGTCTCGTAHAIRDELRADLGAGKTISQIQDAYIGRFGPQALSVPRNQGASRALYLVPLAAIGLGAALLVVTLRRWRRRSDEERAAAPPTDTNAVATDRRDEYDDRLDQELEKLNRE